MGVCWEPAGLPEEIWSQIVNHLEVVEYAQISGTCKVISDLQPDVPNLCVDCHLTVEELNFITRRCKLGDCHLSLTESVAIRFLEPCRAYSAQHPAQPWRVVTVATEGPVLEARPQDALLKHLAAQGSLQHLRILKFEDQGFAGKGVEDEPLNSLLSAPDDKIPSARGQLSRSPFCNSLTHLIVKTDRTRVLPSFRALRTLCLEHSKSKRVALPAGMGVDVTGVPTLEHLANAPFVFSGMWTSKNLPLASFFLIDWNGAEDAALEAVDKILTQDAPLYFVYMELDHAFGNSLKPLEISEQRWRGLLTVSHLRLSTGEGCIMRLPDASPAWKCLNITSGGEIDLGLLDAGCQGETTV